MGPASPVVADNSIRPGILKDAGQGAIQLAQRVADNSIRPGILKAWLGANYAHFQPVLQTTRSDRGY